MKRRIFSILLALALLLSLNVVTALPAAAATLTSVTATPSDDTAGATATYTIQFTTATSGNITTVDMQFPDYFDVSGVGLGTVTGLGAGSIGDSGQVVTYTVTTPVEVTASTAISIGLTLIDNTTTAGTGYAVTVTTKDELAATIDGPTASANFAITPDVVDELIMVQQPSTAVAGVAISPSVTVRAEDQYDNVIAGLSVTASKLAGTGTLSGTTPRTTDGSGIATFNDLSIELIGDKQLQFASGGKFVNSATFAITPAALDAYTVVPDAGTYVAGSAFDVTITAVDQFGNPLGGSYITDPDYTWSTNASDAPDETPPSIGTLVGGDFSAGVAVKTVTLYAAESDVTFTATDNGAKTGTSSVITVNPDEAVSIDISPDDVTITADDSQAYTTEATDVYENTFDVTYQTDFSIDAGALGEWIDDNVYYAEVVGLWTVTGDYDGLSDNTTLTVEPGVVTTLTILVDPGDTVAGEVIGPVDVEAIDGDDNVIPGLEITAGLDSGSGTLSGTLTQMTDGEGIATFDDLWIDLVGAKELEFNANGAYDYTEFVILPAEAYSFVFDAIATQDAGVAFSITITAKDYYGNVATGYVGPAALSELTATIDPATSGNFTAGVWTDSVTIYLPHETNIITATDGDVTGDSVSFIVNPYPVYNIDTGQGYLTIQAAIDAASPADTIEVAPRDYDENLYIEKSLTVQSVEGAEDTEIDGRVEIYLGWDGEDPLAETVVFDGFCIEETEELIYLEVDNGSSLTISNNILVDCLVAIYSEEDTVDNGSSVTIEGNYIFGCDWAGICLEEVVGGSEVTIRGNELVWNSEGICIDYLAEASTVTIEDNLIADNFFGIDFYDVYESTVIIAGNTIGEGYSEFFDEDLYGNSYYGIYFAGEDTVEDSTITIGGDTPEEGNVIIGNGDGSYNGGIYFDTYLEASTVEILNNEILDNYYYGVYINDVEEDSTVTIVDNTIAGNGGGIDIDDVYDYSSVEISDNTIAENDGDGVYVDELCYGSTLDILGNVVCDNTDEGIDVGHVDYGSTLTIRDNSIGENDDGIYVNDVGWDGISGTADDYYADFLEYGASTVTIEENRIGACEDDSQSFNGNYGDGIYISCADFASYITIQDNIISENEEEGITLEYLGDYGEDFYLDEYSSDLYVNPDYPGYFGPVVLVKGNVITDNEYDGIYQYDDWEYGTSVTIEDNLISGNWYSGIYSDYTIMYDASVTIRGNMITSNGIDGGDGGIYDFYVDYASSLTIEDNFISGNWGDGVYIEEVYDKSDLIIRGNTIGAGTDAGGNHHAGNDGDGIYIDEVYEYSTAEISDNTIAGNDGDGIYIDEVYDYSTVEITRNTIAGNDDDGIDIYEVYNNGSVDITRNHILENYYYAIYLYDVSDDGSVGIQYCNIDGNDDGVYYDMYYGDEYLDATYNWWGDPSGPSDYGPGDGDSVSDYVLFSPWLTEPAVWEIKATLSSGWTTLSTPISLDSTADELAELGLDMEIAYGFSGGAWVLITTDNDQLLPCDALYVKMNSAATVIFVPNEDKSDPRSKPLSTGWNLVSLANLVPMALNDALASAYLVPGDLTGYTQVVSPTVNWVPWAYVRGGDSPPQMLPTQVYWVFMNNAGTLAGFTSTPIVLR